MNKRKWANTRIVQKRTNVNQILWPRRILPEEGVNAKSDIFFEYVLNGSFLERYFFPRYNIGSVFFQPSNFLGSAEFYFARCRCRWKDSCNIIIVFLSWRLLLPWLIFAGAKKKGKRKKANFFFWSIATETVHIIFIWLIEKARPMGSWTGPGRHRDRSLQNTLGHCFRLIAFPSCKLTHSQWRDAVRFFQKIFLEIK